jgi:hypothetical protein
MIDVALYLPIFSISHKSIVERHDRCSIISSDIFKISYLSGFWMDVEVGFVKRKI